VSWQLLGTAAADQVACLDLTQNLWLEAGCNRMRTAWRKSAALWLMRRIGHRTLDCRQATLATFGIQTR
jgi:hypothetical protein